MEGWKGRGRGREFPSACWGFVLSAVRADWKRPVGWWWWCRGISLRRLKAPMWSPGCRHYWPTQATSITVQVEVLPLVLVLSAAQWGGNHTPSVRTNLRPHAHMHTLSHKNTVWGCALSLSTPPGSIDLCVFVVHQLVCNRVCLGIIPCPVLKLFHYWRDWCCILYSPNLKFVLKPLTDTFEDRLR